MLQHSVCVAPLKRRHWGEEQFKRVRKVNIASSIAVCKSGENGVILTLPPAPTANPIFPKDTNLMGEKNIKKHGTRPFNCKIPHQ